MRLEGKACLITGGTSSLGAATALALAEQGAALALAARHMDNDAQQTRTRIEALGRKCVLIPADLAKPEDSRRCVHETARRFGSVDMLVHAGGGPVNGGLFEVSVETWQAAFDVHVHAVFHLCRAAVPFMQKKKEGAIILIAVAPARAGRSHRTFLR